MTTDERVGEANGDEQVMEDEYLEFLPDFIEETKEHLASIEIDILNLETDLENIEIIHSMFRAFHSIKGLAGFVEQKLIQRVAHQTETIMDQCRKGSTSVDATIVDLFLKSSDYIKEICNNIALNSDTEFVNSVNHHLSLLKSLEKGEGDEQEEKKIGVVLVEQGSISENDLDDILEKQATEYEGKKLGEVAVETGKVTTKEVIDALRTQKVSNTPGIQSSVIRISADKVDNLADLMGELIITQSLVEQEVMSQLGTQNTIINGLQRLSRITRDVQNLSMSMRMISLRSTFHKLNRIARDTIVTLDKDVVFETQGEETEIDRGIAEKLLEPLVHLIKNGISHGIEDSEERAENNKPSTGRVGVSAYSRRGSVFIQVYDDGSGINTEKVYQKALEKNLIDPSRSYSESEKLEFIFLPGFSTAVNVNSISGRGVGMDVVRTTITRIGGKIAIDSRPGKGSTFTLRIPINSAVMDGTIVDIEGTHYIVPTVNVRQILKPGEEQWISVKGTRKMMRVRDDVIPILPMGEVFGDHVKGVNDDVALVVLMEYEQQLLALPVRNVIGKREIVVKSLGEEFANIDCLAGASILGDGRVALILDVENMFKVGGGMQ